ncbi:MAG: hypothetical protein KF893_01605 [Caldilineaceae bacterium]|nr:hypothetical protein [Caldilineaceae bacterium]
MGIRNLAFLELNRFLFQPALRLDESFDRAQSYFDQAAAYDPARYQPYQLRLQGMGRSLAENDLHATGDAVGDYLQALAHGPLQEREEITLALAALLEARTQGAGGRYLYTDVSNPLSPFPVAFNRCADVELAAIYLSERHVATRQPVPVVLVWRMVTESAEETHKAASASARRDGWAIYSQGNLLFQIGSVRNQLFDGGFEQTPLPRQGYPGNLFRPLYGRQTHEHTRLLYEFPDLGANMILQLDGKGATAVGLGSDPLEITDPASPAAYLISGRYRSEGEAMPRIGIRWLLRDAQGWGDNVSSYVVQQGAAEWTSFAGLQLPHAQADTFQYWVLNADANSQLYVDNLGLFRVPLPCAPGETAP